MKVAVIGCGYVGLTTSVALAYIGHRVHCIEKNINQIKALQNGLVFIHETGVPELLAEVCEQISFGCWDSLEGDADVIIIAVGTPRKKNGDADLVYVEEVARELGSRLSGASLPVIVNKSTVPIGSARRVESIVSMHLRQRGIECPVAVVSNPEFLREGVALLDTFYPDRIVVGAVGDEPVRRLRQLYSPILEQSFTPPGFIPRPDGYTMPPFIVTTPTSAELIKYASNTFLAMKVSYINEIACLAEKVGADIREVAAGIGLDKRIGSRYLSAGVGWGGSCFGKDVQALIHTAGQYGLEMPLSSAAVYVNMRQREEIIKKLQTALKVIRGSTIGLLGLSFKPDTDDLRDAPSITIANRLVELGARVRVYDPVAMENCRKNYPDLEVEYTCGLEELAREADALVLLTEWKEFLHLPYSRLKDLMKQKIIIDGRNVLNAHEMQLQGFQYSGFGR